MGPITIFDKSFLQSLSVDESVWFDHFYLAIVTPFFFVETLADLAKEPKGSRSPETQVRMIADKFPDMSGRPCAVHTDLAVASLFGTNVPMDGVVPVPAGRPVRHKGKIGVVWEESLEAQAFERWQAEEFGELERDFAQVWRAALTAVPIDAFVDALASMGVGGASSRTLEEAKAHADAALGDSSKTESLIALLVMILGVPASLAGRVQKGWREAGSPLLDDYAPYAAHVLRVEIFFQVALSASLISSARPSNRIDMSYLYHLPFCQVFVSCDRLHGKCAPLFLRPDQDFVRGEDLKLDLSRINDYYWQLPAEEREKGIMAFAPIPPLGLGSLSVQLWTRHLREGAMQPDKPRPMSDSAQADLVAALDGFRNGAEIQPGEADFAAAEPDVMVVGRKVRVRRGSWRQIPESAVPTE